MQHTIVQITTPVNDEPISAKDPSEIRPGKTLRTVILPISVLPMPLRPASAAGLLCDEGWGDSVKGVILIRGLVVQGLAGQMAFVPCEA